jgi:NAD(P)-dependent dehydrogenase (short-subunit alcohol dehydrogenase family)
MEQGQLAGRVAIVTGASRGLGRAFALELAAAGASVMLTARSQRDLAETASRVGKLGVRCETVCGDATDPTLAPRAVALTEDRLGPVDLLVNNAGAMLIGSVVETDPDEWWHAMDVNVHGPLLWTQAVLPSMLNRGQGRIINVSSAAAFTQHPCGSAYCASKAALSQLSSCLAAEVAGDGITVLAFGPEALTDMSRALFENEGMLLDRRSMYRAFFTGDPDELLRHSLELFRFIIVGGADHLTGQYVGRQLDGFDTPDTLRARPPRGPRVLG